jgi:uncharacterized membrane-anchored protein
MPATTYALPRPGLRQMLNKVPEVTIYFWVIKVLCTTVGESFADWINTQLGVGLVNTAWIFTGVLVVALAVQLRLKRYVPFPYWLTVVVVSVTGTLYTDILTDQLNVPLWISSAVFSVLLAVVFGAWWLRERTLSIHSVTTLPRESFYWLTVLVTFALGTATGDWTLELTGWSPAVSVLLPLGLIAAIAVLWRFGANPVLSFWLAYILTRPLGANLGDWLASPRTDHGLGLGTAVTSVIFLTAILATVVYLTISRVDVMEERQRENTSAVRANLTRERIMHGYYVMVAAASAALLVSAAGRPHATANNDNEEQTGAPVVTATLSPGEAQSHFPPTEITKFRTITQDTLSSVQAGDQAAARARVKDLESAWDDDQATLQPMDESAWHVLDAHIDSVLKALRASQPDPSSETQTLNALLNALR